MICSLLVRYFSLSASLCVRYVSLFFVIVSYCSLFVRYVFVMFRYFSLCSLFIVMCFFVGGLGGECPPG